MFRLGPPAVLDMAGDGGARCLHQFEAGNAAGLGQAVGLVHFRDGEQGTSCFRRRIGGSGARGSLDESVNPLRGGQGARATLAQLKDEVAVVEDVLSELGRGQSRGAESALDVGEEALVQVVHDRN